MPLNCRIAFFCCFLLASLCHQVSAQMRSVDRFVSISLHAGGMGYMGDLSPTLGSSTQLTKGYFGIGLAKQVSSRLTFSLQGTFGRLYGDDYLVASSNAPAYLRNLHFRNNIAEMGTIFQFDFLRQPYHHSLRQLVRPYLLAGFAVTYHDPKAKAPELLGGLWTPLRLLGTEGQMLNGGKPYSNWIAALPLGAGVRFKLSKRVDFDLNVAYRITFSDYLDDASGAYLDKGRLSGNLLAQYFSDPSTAAAHEPSGQPRSLTGLVPTTYQGSDGQPYSTFHGFGTGEKRASLNGNDSYWTVGAGFRFILSGTKETSQLSRLHQIHHEYEVDRMNRRVIPEEFMKGRTRFELVLLKVNTKYSEIPSSFYRDGILFDSDRQDKKNMSSRSRGNYYNIYYAPLADLQKSELTSPVIFPDPALRKLNHIHALRVAESDKVILSMFEGHDFRRAISHHQLYTANTRAENLWDEVVPLPFDNSAYSVTHAAMTKDGTTIYFVSDMSGGYGGTDIYVSHLHKEQWTMPKNLGPSVNTSENEMYPFLHSDGTLYFASDGRGGMGGLDIFEAYPNTDGGFSKVKNLGAPINSKYNDFGLILDPLKRKGFFASNRPGGQGSNDIYQVNVRQLSSSRMITDEKNLVESKPVELSGVIIDQFTLQAVPKGYVQVNNLITNELQIQNADEDGKFSFTIMSDGRYEIASSALGFRSMDMIPLDSIAKKSPNGNLSVRLEMLPNKIKLLLRGVVSTEQQTAGTSDVLIKLFEEESGQWEEMTTGIDGAYRFRLLRGKLYRLYITKPGYEPHTQEITTYNRNAVETIVVNCVLRRKL